MTSATLYREGLDLEELLAELDEEHPGRVRVVEVTYGRDGGVMGFFARRLVGVHYTLVDGADLAPATAQVDDDFTAFRADYEDEAETESPLEAMLRAAEMVESGRVPDAAPRASVPAPAASTGTPTAENVEFARMLLEMASQKAAERAATRPEPVAPPVAPPAPVLPTTPPAAPVAVAPVATPVAAPVATPAPAAAPEPRTTITDAELDELLARVRRRPVGAHHHPEPVAPVAAAPVLAPVLPEPAWTAQIPQEPRPPAPSAIEAAALAAAAAAARAVPTPPPVPVPITMPMPMPKPEPLAAPVLELPKPVEPAPLPVLELPKPVEPAPLPVLELPEPVAAPVLENPDHAPTADRTTLTLRRQLVEIGVPVPWIPNHSASAYLVVEHLVNRVPIATDFDPEPGQIVVVAGPATHALAEATRLCTRLRIDPSEIRTAGCGTLPLTHRRQAASLAREIREDATAPCIVAVATDSTASAADATGHTDLAWAAGVIAALQADHTVVVVDATSKDSDLRATLRALPGASALAVVRGAATASPAALWGLGIPVSSLDGRPATRGGWAALLIDRLAELDGA